VRRHVGKNLERSEPVQKLYGERKEIKTKEVLVGGRKVNNTNVASQVLYVNAEC
jgi:hypothetical protein